MGMLRRLLWDMAEFEGIKKWTDRLRYGAGVDTSQRFKLVATRDLVEVLEAIILDARCNMKPEFVIPSLTGIVSIMLSLCTPSG